MSVRSPHTLSTIWSQQLSNVPLGISLGRESGSILIWDETNTLRLFNCTGHEQAKTTVSQSLVCACAADDGSGFVAVDLHGGVHRFSPDLTLQHIHSLDRAPLAAALDPFGNYLVVSDQKGRLTVVDGDGKQIIQLLAPRPCVHLAMAVGQDYILACSDYGFVGAFDLGGRWLWRDGLVVHIGMAALGGNGEPSVLSCFSEGIQSYDANGKKQRRWTLPQSIRSVAVTFDGQSIWAGGNHQRLFQLDSAGNQRKEFQIEAPLVSLVISPLGDYIVYTTTKGILHKAATGV